MARIRPHERGFSLVELLVALVFTMVLMAGMANVYKASISSFYTSGEALSNVRRNRMTVDMLADDLNTACIYLKDMWAKPTLNPQTPSFYILPNMPVAGAGANDPPTADELYFFLDQPLSFEATFVAAGGDIASLQIGNGDNAVAPPPPPPNTFLIDCGNATYQSLIKKGQYLLFKDAWDPAYIVADPTPMGTKQVQVTAGLDPLSLVTGRGAYGIPSNRSSAAGKR